jgi:dTMP kinase
MLVTFEGLDGSGKSTQIELLSRRLDSRGHDVMVVREPGGTKLSERIRALLLDSSLHIEPFAELLLFSAARTQLVETCIRPALEMGMVVICDRFLDSTTAYQGSGRGIVEPSWLQKFNQRVTGGLMPDRTYILDIDVEAAATRRSARTPDRMETSGDDFFARVAQGYRNLAEEAPNRILLVDGRADVRSIHEVIWSDLEARLGAGTPTEGRGSSGASR